MLFGCMRVKPYDWEIEVEIARLQNRTALDDLNAQMEDGAATHQRASEMFERTKVTLEKLNSVAHRRKPLGSLPEFLAGDPPSRK